MVRAFYFLNKYSQAFNTQNGIKIILRGIFTFFACFYAKHVMRVVLRVLKEHAIFTVRLH
jgi:hypothetical protein